MVFIVPGEPVGKGRPKFSTRGGFVKTYTPEKTREYENLVRQCYLGQCGRDAIGYFEKDEPVYITMLAFYKIPQSATKKKRFEMLTNVILPTRKPDVDNWYKSITDSLNGYCWHDDSQIVSVHAKKIYGEHPHVTIIISNDERGDTFAGESAHLLQGDDHTVPGAATEQGR